MHYLCFSHLFPVLRREGLCTVMCLKGVLEIRRESSWHVHQQVLHRQWSRQVCHFIAVTVLALERNTHYTAKPRK